MMMKLRFLLLFVFLNVMVHGQEIIDLSGTWNVSLENRNDTAYSQLQGTFEGDIQLPGSLAENNFGYKSEGSDYGILTPEYKYVGKARYVRDIVIPRSWKNKHICIQLERVLWQSVVLVDGEILSKKDALGTAHLHEIGKLKPGKHELSIVIDNEMIHNIGDKGHAYGEYTQSIWNGIVGKMEMKARDHIRITSAITIPQIEDKLLKVDYKIVSDKNYKGRLSYQIVSVKSNEPEISGEISTGFLVGKNEVSLQIPIDDQLSKWSEFNPDTYYLKTRIEAGNQEDSHCTEFAYYEVGHNGTKVTLNGKPVFLRGNLDCVHFPLTGYPSCELSDWERIFRIYKEYGLNHVRFHSWCPPEAAFTAADRIGIYIQAEASIWIDWWMSEDMTLKGRPEMDTKGHPQGLGFMAQRDSFVIEEMNRVVDIYGNHPSFIMFCIGNELGNSDFKIMEKWVAELKKKDPRRLYSVSTARVITPTDDYCATHNIRDIGRTRGLNGPHTNWDFEKVYSQMDIPIIAHEIGQWPVYPQWKEIEKYQGVLKARNFEEFKSQAEKNGIAEQDVDFSMASGALNQIMYKYETESFFRTASCAGVQLLSMQDYQGQGEALIGWLDAHWDSKGITTPSKFKEHYNTVVPLLRFDKYVWRSDETFTAKAQLSNHGESSLMSDCRWIITGENGDTLDNGIFEISSVEPGALADLGQINFFLNKISHAVKINVKLEVKGTEFQNSWDIWVYPSGQEDPNPGNILITDQLDAESLDILENGGKVLLLANKLGNRETSVKTHFYPLYWSLTFFPGQGKTNIGLLLQDDHPVFGDFPTSFHSDWQWETISSDGKGFILNDLPKDYRPLAQAVDDFHRNNKLGSIFELKVGKGSLLVCGYNIESDLLVAKQLKFSLVNYMMSENFKPGEEVEIPYLEEMFKKIQKPE